MNDVTQRIEAFRAALTEHEVSYIVGRDILDGIPYVLEQAKYYDLKREIAGHFRIHTNNIFMVGSGKLGFSIKPSKRYTPFGERSDIDIAIVDDTLFTQIWQEVYKYNCETGFWPRIEDFRKYLFRGWIRPDMLPPGNSFEISKRWWDFFRDLTATNKYGPYKIRAGIYHSTYFLEEYQSICVKQCKLELEH